MLHGSSLVKEGTKLLHLLSSVFVIVYIVNRNFHHVRAVWRGTRSVFRKTIVSHDCHCYCFSFLTSYLKISSGLICTREQVLVELEADYAGYSVKPKMMVITSSLLFLMAITFLYSSALRTR